MRRYRTVFACFMTALLVAFIAGCGQETVTIPGVVSVTPAQGATSVANTTTVTATFNEAMSPASITAAGTFTLMGPSGAVTGVVTYSGLTATFTPSAVLPLGATYTATITTAAATPGGAELVSNYVWTFSTSAVSVLTVVGFPAQGAHVAASTAITATFSLAMNCTTLQSPATTFTLSDSSGIVPGTVTCAGNVATFVPTGGLPASNFNRTYTATVTTGATSLAEGVSLPINYVWTFTVTAPVLPAPTVTLTNPVNTATNVPLNQVVIARFSEPMAPATIDGTSNFTLTVQGSPTPVAGSVSYVETGSAYELVFQLSPNVFLQPSTTYTATISNGVTNLAGTALNGGVIPTVCATVTNGNCVWNFTTTASGVNNAQPVLVTTVPANGAIDVCMNPAISATFSEAMNKQTFTSSTFYLYLSTDPNQTPIPGTYSYDANDFIETFTPTAVLTTGDSYTATATDGATNMAGIGLLVSASGPPQNPWTFTVGASTCKPPINLGVLAPFGGAAGAGGMTNMGDETVVNGEIATTAAASSVTGFYDESSSPAPGVYPCNYTAGVGANYGLVTNGTNPPSVSIFTDAPPVSNALCLNEGDAATYLVAQNALAQALTTYNTLQSSTNPATGTTPAAPQGSNTISTDLGGETLHPGVYWSASTVDITTGDLTLDAQGDPNATFVFQVGSALTVGAAGFPRNIILAHGALAKNVYWLCASAATINGAGGGTFNGTVIADATISTGTSGITTITTIDGRLISLGLSSPSASTTLVNTVINTPAP